MYCAGAGGLIQLFNNKPVLFSCSFHVAPAQCRLKMLNLRLYLALARAISRPSFDILPASLLGR
jgi:hypothetical protein